MTTRKAAQIAIMLSSMLFALGGIAALEQAATAAETCGDSKCVGNACETGGGYECIPGWIVFNEQGQPLQCQNQLQTGTPCCIGWGCVGGGN